MPRKRITSLRLKKMDILDVLLSRKRAPTLGQKQACDNRIAELQKK